MFLSTRRDGRSLGKMARDELGPVGGYAAMIGTLMILVILIAVLGLVDRQRDAAQPMGDGDGVRDDSDRDIGRPLSAQHPAGTRDRSVGHRLQPADVRGCRRRLARTNSRRCAKLFDLDSLQLAWFVMGYGFIAAIVPVWLLLAPRDYLSTFLKIGTVILLAVAVVWMHPQIKMPAVTQFIDGTGPVFGGKIFPFVFITIACGAISGFHALVSSGTTPKLIGNELDVRPIGYGSMMLESFVAVIALIAATLLEPGVYFAINSPGGLVGTTAEAAVQTISSWGFPVTAEQMHALASEMGEMSLFARTGGAPSLAVGMATIFSSAFGDRFLAVWYHFAIMFEAVFILTTLDAGTRVGRFMVQDFLGHVWQPMGQTSWYPSVLISSALVVGGWGYFLYIGVIDPNGGVNILWPLFGIANQMLAAIALSVATAIIVKQGKLRYAWVTGIPLAWLAIITSTAAWQKIFAVEPRIGFIAGANDLAAKLAAGLLPAKQAAVAPQLIFNQKLDAVLTVFFAAVLWLIIADALRTCWRVANGRPVVPSTEAMYVPIANDPAVVRS